jgi:hypothetical protein
MAKGLARTEQNQPRDYPPPHLSGRETRPNVAAVEEQSFDWRDLVFRSSFPDISRPIPSETRPMGRGTPPIGRARVFSPGIPRPEGGSTRVLPSGPFSEARLRKANLRVASPIIRGYRAFPQGFRAALPIHTPRRGRFKTG